MDQRSFRIPLGNNEYAEVDIIKEAELSITRSGLALISLTSLANHQYLLPTEEKTTVPDPLALLVPTTAFYLKKLYSSLPIGNLQEISFPAEDRYQGESLKHGTIIQCGNIFIEATSGRIDMNLVKRGTTEICVEFDERYCRNADIFGDQSNVAVRRSLETLAPGVTPKEIYGFRLLSGLDKPQRVCQVIVRVFTHEAIALIQRSGHGGIFTRYVLKAEHVERPAMSVVWLFAVTLRDAFRVAAEIIGFMGLIRNSRGLGARFLNTNIADARLRLRPEDDRLDEHTAQVIVLRQFHVQGAPIDTVPTELAKKLRERLNWNTLPIRGWVTKNVAHPTRTWVLGASEAPPTDVVHTTTGPLVIIEEARSVQQQMIDDVAIQRVSIAGQGALAGMTQAGGVVGPHTSRSNNEEFALVLADIHGDAQETGYSTPPNASGRSRVHASGTPPMSTPRRHSSSPRPRSSPPRIGTLGFTGVPTPPVEVQLRLDAAERHLQQSEARVMNKVEELLQGVKAELDTRNAQQAAQNCAVAEKVERFNTGFIQLTTAHNRLEEYTQRMALENRAQAESILFSITKQFSSLEHSLVNKLGNGGLGEHHPSPPAPPLPFPSVTGKGGHQGTAVVGMGSPFPPEAGMDSRQVDAAVGGGMTPVIGGLSSSSMEGIRQEYHDPLLGTTSHIAPAHEEESTHWGADLVKRNVRRSDSAPYVSRPSSTPRSARSLSPSGSLIGGGATAHRSDTDGATPSIGHVAALSALFESGKAPEEVPTPDFDKGEQGDLDDPFALNASTSPLPEVPVFDLTGGQPVEYRPAARPQGLDPPPPSLADDAERQPTLGNEDIFVGINVQHSVVRYVDLAIFLENWVLCGWNLLSGCAVYGYYCLTIRSIFSLQQCVCLCGGSHGLFFCAGDLGQIRTSDSGRSKPASTQRRIGSWSTGTGGRIPSGPGPFASSEERSGTVMESFLLIRYQLANLSQLLGCARVNILNIGFLYETGPLDVVNSFLVYTEVRRFWRVGLLSGDGRRCQTGLQYLSERFMIFVFFKLSHAVPYLLSGDAGALLSPFTQNRWQGGFISQRGTLVAALRSRCVANKGGIKCGHCLTGPPLDGFF